MTVQDRMSTPPITIDQDESYQTALKVMEANRLHHLPVVDGAGRLVGMLAERDLLLAATQYKWASVEVEQVMSKGLITATADLSLAEAAEKMLQHHIGGLPVVDADNRVIGVLTETDLLRALVKLEQG